MINLVIRIIIYAGLVLLLAVGSAPAQTIEKVDVNGEEQQSSVDTDETARIDIYLGLHLPYSTIGNAYDYVREISLDGYDIIVPKVHGGFDWGGAIGIRQISKNNFGGTVEISVYRGSHDYSRYDMSGKAELTSFNIGFCAFYTAYPVHPMFYFGGSLLSMDVRDGAEDALFDRTDALFSAAATDMGVGFNLPLRTSVWLSCRIAYRRYWFYNIEVDGNDHTLGDTIKSDGLWLLFSINAGIRIK